MELRDYARMLKRGWRAITLITVAFAVLAVVYLAVAPKRYESSAVLFVSAGGNLTVDDLQQASQFSARAVSTYAQIIDSATVLDPVAQQLGPQFSVDKVIEMITTSVPDDTTLIVVSVSGDDPVQVAVAANLAATNATRIIPTLESAPDGRSLIRLQPIQQAAPPSAPVSPNTKRVLALAFIVGLCVGLAVTIAAQTLDNRIRRPDDVGALGDLPVLAVLPQPKRAQRQGVAVRDEPSGAASEAFRTLRTNLRFLEAAGRRSLVMTSATDDRDGAQVPTNLAWSLAQAGRQVLLVDVDLRRSAVGESLGLPPGLGLADVLSGRTDLAKAIEQTLHPCLRVIRSGTAQPSPSDLLSTPNMTRVLRWMEHEYEYVILHAPPLRSYTDAAVLSSVAGATVLTLGTGRTRTQELVTAVKALANVRVQPAGVVLTGAQRPGRLRNRAARVETPVVAAPPVPAGHGSHRQPV